MKKGKSEKVLATLLLALALAALACGGKNSGNPGNSNAVLPMRVVTDDLGRRVTIPVKVTRVVSLAPNLTEEIFAVGAGDRLVGVTTFCNYPDQAKAIAKIGDTLNPNMESIVALKPDIVFVSTASQMEAFTKTLEANGIAVYVTNPVWLKDIYKNLIDFGIIFDTKNISEAIVENLKARELAVGKKYDVAGAVGRIPVFVQISREPLFTVGGTSFIGQLVGEAGGYLLTKSMHEAFPKLSKETAYAMNPEAIILSDSEDNKEPNDAFKNSSAVKNGRVYKINADIISRPGPRLVDALEQIARDLHPDKFK